MNKTLLVGQLKAIADPFYTHLHAVAPVWLEAERTANGTNHPGSIFPWTTATADDNNKGMANIGQLKAVFSLRFGHDADIDGMPDLWEAAHGFDNDNPADAQADPDGDGITNALEFQLGTDPNTQNPIGPRNLGFGDEITDSPDLSFRPENPSDLYPEDSVPHWRAAIGQHIEIWDEGDGNPYAELQSHWDAKGIEQQFNMLPGTRLTFILRYKGRYDGYNDSNPFKLKVEGAYDVTVDGQAAPTVGTSHQESFMTDDEWDKYAEWHHALIAITAPHSASLVPITLSLIPEDTDEAITYGGFVDLVNVDVEDNVVATGVDRISRTVSRFSAGFQEDFWIMAPLQGPGSFTYENLTKFGIGLGENDTGILSCENATSETDVEPSNRIILNGQPQNVLWQGVGSGVDSEKSVKLNINGSQTATELPVKVKAMKHRTVNVTLYKIADDLLTGTPEGIIDADLIPTELQLENYLNEIYGRQVNTWFDVAIKEEQVETPVDHDPNGVFDFGLVDHSRDQREIALDAIDQAGAAAANTNIKLYLLGTNKQIDNPTAVGAANILMRTCWVKAKVNNSARVEEEMDELLATIAHEFGHVVIGEGHPSDNILSERGPAPLPGTRHIERLMWAHANKPPGTPNLIVKGEWDEIEDWLLSEQNAGRLPH